jgi:hypothetical protein
MAVELGRLGLDCQKCTAQQKVFRGCEKNFEGTWTGVFAGLKRCPKKVVDYSNFRYVEAYNLLSSGVLMNPGCYMDQPAKLNDAVSIIRNHISK